MGGPNPSDSRYKFPGYSPLKSLAYGITEEKQTNYKDEESMLTEINNEVKSLIVELENKKDEAQT